VAVDCVVGLLAVLLQAIGWLCLVSSRMSLNQRFAMAAEMLLLACLFGLGTVMLVGAAIHSGCALSAGVATILLALVAIFQPRRSLLADPYTLIYPPDPRA
jgi:hypothetical protein